MRFPRKRGSTSVMIRVFIPDNSVTTGAGCTALAYNSTNLALAFTRELQNGGTEITGANITQIATIGTWASPGTGKLGFGAVDAAKFPGLYEIHFPDDCTAFGTGDASQAVYINVYEKTTTALKIGPNMVMIPLAPLNLLSGESDIQMIKTQAVTCAAGVTVLANVGAAGAPGANNGFPTTNGTKLNQTVDLTAGQSIAVSDKTGFSLATAPPTAAENADAVWDEATSGHAGAGTAGKALTDANNGTPPTAAAIADAVCDEAASGHTGFLATNLDATVSSRLQNTSALATESYAADGGTPTLSQILWMIWAALVDFAISGTTLTVKKQDGTTAMTFTLDSATSPTSRTRAT